MDPAASCNSSEAGPWQALPTGHQRTIGLIAGSGRLPVLVAQGIRAAGHRVVCVGFRGNYEAELPGWCDHFAPASLTHLGKWIRLLKRWDAPQAIMVGKVGKTKMYDPLRYVRNIPDWRAAKIWFLTLRHDRRTDRMLCAVADELKGSGITLIDSTSFIADQMADAGVMTQRRPSASQQRDIQFALPIVLRMGDLDIGQAIAVKDGEVIAVEAIEGTAAMIARAGELCKSGRWTLIKMAKPQQDMRFDVPTVGLGTLDQLKAAGATCLAIQAGKCIMLDKPDFLKQADKLGIAVVGVWPDRPVDGWRGDD